jgi:hypothetical protein
MRHQFRINERLDNAGEVRVDNDIRDNQQWDDHQRANVRVNIVEQGLSHLIAKRQAIR